MLPDWEVKVVAYPADVVGCAVVEGACVALVAGYAALVMGFRRLILGTGGQRLGSYS